MNKMKNKIRKELIEIRKNLSRTEIIKNSKEIKKRLFELNEFKKASTILFYISYDNEVFTHDMIKESISNGKNVIVPISDKENRRLILSKFNNWDDLKLGSYNILEPGKDKINEISIEEVDLIIVPGVGFDARGHRIGHGKGYYDNLLRKSGNILNIGLAFETQVVKKIPTDTHDLPVNMIVTEKRVINCKN
jgi:5-formyltetrahydrofolate cyclo-ligase